jgi:hypothetical protein
VQGFKEEQIGVERYLNLRYDGTDVPVMTAFAADGKADPAKAFEKQYKREFGFVLEVTSCCLVCSCSPRMCISFVQNGACSSVEAIICCFATCVTKTLLPQNSTSLRSCCDVAHVLQPLSSST